MRFWIVFTVCMLFSFLLWWITDWPFERSGWNAFCLLASAVFSFFVSCADWDIRNNCGD